MPRAFNFKPLEIETMAKKQNAKPAKEAPKAEPVEEQPKAAPTDAPAEGAEGTEADAPAETTEATDAPAEEQPKEAPKAEPKPVMTPLEEAKLQQFKRMFPRECELLIKEFKAANGQ